MTCDGMLFFFKQKTAYERRISDWSSDVCSSDLVARLERAGARSSGRRGFAGKMGNAAMTFLSRLGIFAAAFLCTLGPALAAPENYMVDFQDPVTPVMERIKRSEERSVGKECVGKCRSRW